MSHFYWLSGICVTHTHTAISAIQRFYLLSWSHILRVRTALFQLACNNGGDDESDFQIFYINIETLSFFSY